MKIDLLIIVKPTKLKFGVNIRINKSIMCVNFGNLRSRDCELSHNKIFKKRRFLA